ncbi:MAG: hypothetical protein JWM57_1241 [Phycisphaerales bacterium]|nr:hypothetical protein [Phycisphaerales bacterium]
MRFAFPLFTLTTALLATSIGHAATITIATDGTDADALGGADTFVTRNSVASAATDGNLAVVNRAATDNNADRVPFLRFDTSGALSGGPLTVASLRLTLGANASPAGLVVQIYGIPDAALNENFDATTITFANSGYTTGSGSVIANDATDNSVLDSSLTLLGTLAAPTINTTYTFSSADLLTFLNADTNGIASFVLATTVITAGGTSTPVFASSDSVAFTADQLPALIVDVPEPTAVAALGAIACGLTSRRKRRA